MDSRYIFSSGLLVKTRHHISYLPAYPDLIHNYFRGWPGGQPELQAVEGQFALKGGIRLRQVRRTGRINIYLQDILAYGAQFELKKDPYHFPAVL